MFYDIVRRVAEVVIQGSSGWNTEWERFEIDGVRLVGKSSVFGGMFVGRDQRLERCVEQFGVSYTAERSGSSE